jgi:hypothetical protein
MQGVPFSRLQPENALATDFRTNAGYSFGGLVWVGGVGTVIYALLGSCRRHGIKPSMTAQG